MSGRTLWWVGLAAVLAAAIVAYFHAPSGEWLSIAQLKTSRAWLAGLVDAQPAVCIAGFFLLCVVATAACFPAAPVLGVSGGALFGFWPGLALVLVASSIGSTIAFFESRHSLRAWVRRRFARRIAAIDRGMEAHGGLYLLALRINPVVPYWLVNLAMGLTAIRPRTYVALTIAGLVPATFIYVSAGTQLATIESARDILSPQLAATLLLLSALPFLVRAAASIRR